MTNKKVCIFCGEKTGLFRASNIVCGGTLQLCCVSCENELKELTELEQCHRALRLGLAGDQEKILRINALGTVYVNQEFSKLMNPGSVICDISSNSAYSLPSFIVPKKYYPLAEIDESAFLAKMIKRANLAKTDYEKNGFAYSISKNFVCWYAAKSAFDLGLKGIRVVSLSPGLIATDMGKLEEENGGFLLKFACEERMGKVEELGFAIATVADERNGYLAGVDILCDGGSTRGMKEFKKNKK